jgi:hypothetical protein
MTAAVFALCLSGCIGSQFVVDDADTDAPYPDLHKVPERPDLPDHLDQQGQDLGQVQQSLTVSQKEALDENMRLRQDNGL